MGCTSSKPAVANPSATGSSGQPEELRGRSSNGDSNSFTTSRNTTSPDVISDDPDLGRKSEASNQAAASSPLRKQSSSRLSIGGPSSRNPALSSRFMAGSETFDVDRLNTVASYSDAMISAGSQGSHLRASPEIETIMEVYAIPETIRYFLRTNERDRMSKKLGPIVNNDLINDISTLYNKTTEPLINSLYPPVSTAAPSPQITATLMRLETENKSNSKFFEMIEATYKNTNKAAAAGGNQATSTAAGTSNLRLTLILNDGTSKALHFLTNSEYWLFLRSVRRHLRDEPDNAVTMRCIWNRSGTASTSSDASGLRSFMSGSSKSSSQSANTVDLKCRIDGGVISFAASSVKTSIFGMSYGNASDASKATSQAQASAAAPSASPLPDIRIEDILAIAKSLDYVLQKTVVMEVDFLSYTWDEDLLEAHGVSSAANSALCLDAHHETTEYELPITFTNVGSRKMIFLSEADLKTNDGNVRLNIYTNPRIDAASSERIKVGTFEVNLGSIPHEMRRAADQENSQVKTMTRARSLSNALTCLPTLTPFHSNFPKLPLLENIILSVPEHRRMLRLVIHSAINLLGFGEDGDLNAAPKAKLNIFCTIELKSATGEVLSGSSYTHKTATITGNYDPVWESDFYFPMQIDGKEIDSILVKLRDANGYLRHRLIGQVSIPSAVFVAVNELALLRLPIDAPDPSETSENLNAYDTLGMLCIGTQTCPRIDSMIDKAYQSKAHDAPSTAITPSVAPPSTNAETKRPADLSRQLSSAGSATVSVCLRDVAPSETCWPYAEIASSAILSEQLASVDTSPVSQSTVITVGHGHLFTGVDHLVIMPSADFDNTLLRASVEFDVASSVLEPVIRIPWNHVYRVDSISEATLMITFTLHLSKTTNIAALHPAPSNVGKQSSKYNNPLTNIRPGGAFEASILIAPCPSEAVAAIIRERLILYPIRSMVKTFWKSASKVSYVNADAPPEVDGVASSIELLSMAKSILSIIEKDHFAPFDTTSASGALNHDVVRTGLKAKTQVLFGFLIEGCRALHNDLSSQGRGWYDVVPNKLSGSASLPIVESHVRELIKIDLISSIEVLDGMREKSSEKITRRLEYFMEQCEDHLHELVLCNWDMIHPGNMICAFDTLLREFQMLFRSTLEKLISTNESFSETLQGLGNKADFVKFILIRNKVLDGSVKRTLTLTGLGFDDLPEARKLGHLYLLSPTAVDHIVSMFSGAVLAETRLWLSRTLDSQIQARRKYPDLPWDFDNVEGMIISPVPETFRYQINIYLSLCYEHFGNEEGNDDTDPSSRGRSVSDAANVNALLALNGHIVKAVLKSLLILADEYRRALQSKHWEEVTNADDMITNLQYLVSIANDCYRLNAVHVDAVLSIKAIDAHESEYYDIHSYASGDNITMEDLALQVTSEFDNVLHIAKKYIVRMLFADMTNIILDFDELWERSHPQVFKNTGKSSSVIARTAHSLRNAQSSVLGLVSGNGKAKQDVPVCEGPPLETILATLADYFKDLRVMLDNNLFMKVLVACADVLVVLYLLFLKDFSERTRASFIPTELLSAIKEDLEAIRNCIGLVEPNEPGESVAKPALELPSLAKKLKCLQDVVTILSFDAGNVRVISLLKELALAYGIDADGVAAIESLVKTCALLRGLVEVSNSPSNAPIANGQDTVEDVVAAWHNSVSIHRRAVPAGTTIASGDIYLRVFKPDKSTPSSETGKNQSAMRMIREKASNININPIDAHKKKKEASAVSVLRKLGLYELEKPVVKQSESMGSNASSAASTPGQRRSFTRPSKGDTTQGSLSHTESSESSIFDIGDVSFLKSDKNVTTSASFDHYNFSDRITDIVISRIRLKHIKSQSVIANANPYVVFTLTFKNGPEPKSVKTGVKWNSPDASWTDELSFKSVGITSIAEAVLDVKVFDKEHIRRKRLIGSAEVRLGGLDMRPIGSWFALDGGAAGMNGEIFLNVTTK